MAGNEFNRSDPHAVDFRAKNSKVYARLEFPETDLSQLTDDERKIVESTVAGFAVMLATTLKDRPMLAQIGLNLADAFTVILEKVQEANEILGNLRSHGHSRMG